MNMEHTVLGNDPIVASAYHQATAAPRLVTADDFRGVLDLDDYLAYDVGDEIEFIKTDGRKYTAVVTKNDGMEGTVELAFYNGQNMVFVDCPFHVVADMRVVSVRALYTEDTIANWRAEAA